MEEFEYVVYELGILTHLHKKKKSSFMIVWTISLIPVIWQTFCQCPFVSHFLPRPDWALFKIYLDIFLKEDEARIQSSSMSMEISPLI